MGPTVDIAATMMDFAGIIPAYEMDGKSWKDAIENPAEEEDWKNNRCLFFEMDQDRAVRCGCYKYLNIFARGSSTWQSGNRGDLSNDLENFFDLCNENNDYVIADDDNRERAALTVTIGEFEEMELKGALECHLENTDPDSTPNYSVCTTYDQNDEFDDLIESDDDEFDDLIESDDNEFDDNDTSAPTCGDSPFVGVIGEYSLAITCLSISGHNQQDRCAKKRFWSHCQKSCDKCTDSDTCTDSLLTFTHPTLGNIKCGEIDLVDCDMAGIRQTCPETCGACWE